MYNCTMNRRLQRKRYAVLGSVLLLYQLLRKRRRNRRFWVRSSLQKKRTNQIIKTIQTDDISLTEDNIHRSYFKAFVPLPFSRFQSLHEKIPPMFEKKNSNYQRAISSLERLSITLHFLATGDSFDTLEKIFGVSKSAICKLIPETVRAIIVVLKDYIITPNTEQQWNIIAADFFTKWNFPNCIGAIDGRHCPIIQPKFSGTEFYNYKHFVSVILLAVVDASYKFIYIDVGAQGKASDGGVFQNCQFKLDIDAGKLHLPKDKPLPGGISDIPFVFIADDAFPLSYHIMKPYPGIGDKESPMGVYNYRLSRARRVVENAFGIVSSRFRVLRKPMQLTVDNATLVILTTCYLHNFIKTHAPDNIDDLNEELPRTNEQADIPTGFFPLRNQPRRTIQAVHNIRDEFRWYFNSDEGRVPWPIPFH